MVAGNKTRGRIVTVAKNSESGDSNFIKGIPAGDRVRDIPLKRLDFDDTELEFRVDHKIKDLVDDIGKNGQQFPVILRPYENSHTFQIVSGFRRCRALRALGWETVKAIVRNDLDEEMAFRVSFLENDKRKSLTGLDKANAIVKLRIKGKKDSEIGEIYGIGQKQIDRYKKISTFPVILKNALSRNVIQTTHGLALMAAYEAHGPAKVILADWVSKIAEEDLSVRQLARELNSVFGKAPKAKKYFENRKGGGFRIYPMLYDPQKTKPEIKEKMRVKLKMALELLAD